MVRYGKVEFYFATGMQYHLGERAKVEEFVQRWLPDGWSVHELQGGWRSPDGRQITERSWVLIAFLPMDTPAHVNHYDPKGSLAIIPAIEGSIYKRAETIAENLALEFGQQSVYSFVHTGTLHMTTAQAAYKRNG